MNDTQEFTLEEVQKHCTKLDLWLIIDGYVFDVTKFLMDHPGGSKILLQYAGKECGKEFAEVGGHNDGYADGLLDELCIGKLK